MDTSRREFLGQGGAVLAGAAMLSSGARAASPMNMPVGFQAYEIIADLNKDFDGTLKRMASFGYKFIDMVATGPYLARTAKDLRAAFDAAGLGCDNCHWGYNNFSTGYSLMMTYSQALGVKSVVCGPKPKMTTAADWKSMADDLNKFGATVAKDGMFLAYHNHEIEFRETEGQMPYDILMAGTDPKLVRFQIDVGNLTFGGADALNYLKKYPTRYFSLHAKDFVKGKAAVPVGQGSLDWKAIFAAAKAANIRSYIAEVGAYNASTLSGPLEPSTIDIIESFRQSATYLINFKDA